MEQLADAMIRLFTQSDIESCIKRSYEIAEDYLTDRIVDRWRKLILGDGPSDPDPEAARTAQEV